jgi:hypothetical protein
MRFRFRLGVMAVAWRTDTVVEAAETAVRTADDQGPRRTTCRVSACDLDAAQWVLLLPRGVRHSARLFNWEEAAFWW